MTDNKGYRLAGLVPTCRLMTRNFERAAIPEETLPPSLRRYWSDYLLAAFCALAWLRVGPWAVLAGVLFLTAWGLRGPARWNLPRRAFWALLRPDGVPRGHARGVRLVLEAEGRGRLPERIVFTSWAREGSWRCPDTETLEVKLWAGEHVERWQRRAAALGAQFGAIRTKVEQARPGVVRVRLVYVDPLSALALVDPPHLSHEGPTDFLREPVPLGRSEEGEEVGVLLKDAHLLIGGQPGTGKSLIHLVIAWAALDPSVQLVLLDGKGLSELETWVPLAWRVGETITDAVAVLQAVEAERLRRAAARRAEGLRSWPLGAVRPILIAIDELSVFVDTEGLDRAERAEVQLVRRLLGDLVRLGRADRIMVVAATQKPDSSVVPTAMRDQMQLRIALRCGSREHSDTVLGSGMAAQGADASELPWGQPGSFILAGTAAQPVWGRVWWMHDGRLERVLDQARDLRYRPTPVASPALPFAPVAALPPGGAPEAASG